MEIKAFQNIRSCASLEFARTCLRFGESGHFRKAASGAFALAQFGLAQAWVADDDSYAIQNLNHQIFWL